MRKINISKSTLKYRITGSEENRLEMTIKKSIGAGLLPEEWVNMSRSWRDLSQFSMAERAIRQGMREKPGHLGLENELVEIFVAKKDWPKALERCRMVVNKYKHRSTDAKKIMKLVEQKQAELQERQQLLSYEFKQDKVIKVTDEKLSGLDKKDLIKELRKINKNYISWKKQAGGRAGKSDNFISIIVLVLDNLELTARCVESIFTKKTSLDFEVLIVNNGSTASAIKGLRKLHKRFPMIRLIHSEQNLNFSLGNNIGFSESRGDICVFLNNDTYVTDFWLDNLVASLESKDTKAAQPTLLYPDESIQNIGIVFSQKSPLGYPLYANSKNKKLIKDRRLQAVTAACVAVYSHDFAAVNGFDPAFINGQEDVDLCLRLIKQLGGACFCTSNSVVYHDEGKSSGRGRFFVHNRQQFIKRWQNKIAADDEKYYSQDNYFVKSWQVDSNANLKAGIELYKPVLEKNKTGKI